MSAVCKSIGCCNPASAGDFCIPCVNREVDHPDATTQTLAERYPDQYRALGDYSEIDVYGVLHLFEIPDLSGCLQQATMKLLMTGTSQQLYRDVREARDHLTRWLQLNQESNS